jgi:hypothetical protein
VFSKQSRYRQVPDIAVPDARGRVLAAKDIRALPDVTGTFRHRVDSGDRLDQLSYSYYGNPLQYWHICDANPQFLSPLALLDQDPVTTTRFPVTTEAADPPWAAVLSALSATIGVEQATVEQAAGSIEALRVTYNRLTVDADALSAVIGAAGFTVGQHANIGQLGQQIVIPSAVSG